MKKTAKAKRAIRRGDLACAIELEWESLRSHLSAAVKCASKDGNEEWHARCVRDYAKIMLVLAQELHELAMEDFPVSFTSADGPLSKSFSSKA